MPSFRDDDGVLVIDPMGDILFADGHTMDGQLTELIIAEPGPSFEPGSVHTEYCGKRTGEINTLVRLRLTPLVCAILIERIAIAQTKLMGMPPLIDTQSE